MTALPPAAEVPDGESVVAAVRRDLERLRLGSGQATAVATALALARVLDDPQATPQRAAAARELTKVMDGLNRRRQTPRRTLGGLA